MGKGAGPRGLPLVFDGHNDALLKLTLPKPGEERGFVERGALRCGLLAVQNTRFAPREKVST